jgi:hypothetical protein
MVFMDSKQNLSPFVKDILDQIEAGQETKEGKGIIVILGKPSNNEGTACVFSLRGGTTVGYKREEFVAALAELIQGGFIMELDREDNQIRYKLIDK